LLAKVGKIRSHGTSLTPLPAQETRVEHGEEEGEHHDGMYQALGVLGLVNPNEFLGEIYVLVFTKKNPTRFWGVFVFKKSTVNERISRLRCEAGESDCWPVGVVNCNYYR